MIEPVTEHAAQQIGPPQKRTIGRRRRAHREMVAAASPGMASVDHELFGAQARFARVFVEIGGQVDQLAPVVRRVDIDLDDARVGRHLENLLIRLSTGGV